MFVWKPKGRPVFYYRFRHPITRKLVSKAGEVTKEATQVIGAQALKDAANEKAGILPNAHAKRPLFDHLADFLDHLRAKDTSAGHVATREKHVTAVAAGLDWSRLRDLDGRQLENLLAKWRREKARFGAQTANHYVASWRHFARWLVREGRLAANPFAAATMLNVGTDRRHERRALDAPELAHLLAVIRGRPVLFHLTGPQRAVLYLTAARTGLRALELSSLTPESFDLKSDPPAWTLGAAAEKARRGDRLPLFPELADALRAYLPTVAKGQPLWPGYWARAHAAAKMLRPDLAAAGIAYKTDDGYFDFHAFRVTFITDMARANVPLQVAMRLARHCDPKLTAKIYSRFTAGDLAGQLAKLPRTLPPEA